MMSHLKNDHVVLKLDQSQRKNPDLNKSGVNGTRKKRSRVWEYFCVNPDNANQCICVICNESVNYINKGTSSMTSHLKCEHDIWVIKFERKLPSVKRGPRKITKKEPVIDPETGEIKKNVECRAKRRKDLWKHFESFPQDNLKALCKICQHMILITEKSSISQTLVKHLNTHDIKLELETCSVCGKTFEERAKRRKHEKNHQVKCSCSFCGKMFSDNTARILHERTHTGEKPFQARHQPLSFQYFRQVPYYTSIFVLKACFCCSVISVDGSLVRSITSGCTCGCTLGRRLTTATPAPRASNTSAREITTSASIRELCPDRRESHTAVRTGSCHSA